MRKTSSRRIAPRPPASSTVYMSSAEDDTHTYKQKNTYLKHLRCSWLVTHAYTKTGYWLFPLLSSFFYHTRRRRTYRTKLDLAEGRAIISMFSSGRSIINLELEETWSSWMRAQWREMHEKKGMMRKHSLFLWSSAAVTQICTLAVIHNGTCYNPGHGWRHFQNKRFQFIYISCSPFHHFSLSAAFAHFSVPFSSLSLSVSTFISLLHYLLFISTEIKPWERWAVFCMKAAFALLARLEHSQCISVTVDAIVK